MTQGQRGQADAAERNWFDGAAATFGDRLAGAREAAGLSQRELAQRLGVRTKVVQAWEDDLKEPRANRLQMLAGMLNVSIMWLLTGEGDGLASPAEHGAIPPEAAQILPEIARLRSELAGLADHLGHLESRLRRALAGAEA
ncbi:helix-turn-helix domain-containing protein [Albidovulum sp.]